MLQLGFRLSLPHVLIYIRAFGVPNGQTVVAWHGVYQINSCPYCPAHSLDPMGHHALTCKHGGDVVTRHNRLRDVFVESCRRACIGVQVEVGGKYGLEERRKRPADVLATNWMLGKPAAFDFTVTSPLVSNILPEASVTARSAAFVAEERKHRANDAKCAELGWVSIPLAVETYGCHKTKLSKIHSHCSVIWKAESDSC